MQRLLDGLNEQQAQAVTSDSPVILTLAGAGSGKTRVLTHRIAHLVENRVSTSNMLALTFTRLAAKEMKERLIRLIGENNAKKLFCGTFHSFCVKVLREWGNLINIEPNFTIYDEEDRRAIVEAIISEFKFKKVKVSDVLKHLGQWDKALFMLGDEGKVIKEYLYQLKQNNALDLDMLLHKTNDLLDIDQVRDYYRNIYRYVFVDEYQDTSSPQDSIIQKLSPENLFVVGDDYQGIYGWRGANIQNILLFNSSIRYPDAEVVKLEQNYRSTNQIVKAANSLISHNVNQTHKTLIAGRDGEPVTITFFGDEKVEAKGIAGAIRQLGIDDYSNAAVLARTNRQLLYIKGFLDQQGIPCQLVNNQDDVFKMPVVKDVLTCIQAAHNPKDNVVVKKAFRILQPNSVLWNMDLWELQAVDKELSLMEILEGSEHPEAVGFLDLVSKIKEVLNEDFQDAEHVFLQTISILGLRESLAEMNLTYRINHLDDAHKQISRWQEVQNGIGLGEDYATFIQYLNTRDIQEKLVQEKVNAVKLLTVHAAKGLEFSVVFIAGMNQGLFPAGQTKDMEEERRLFYVALTRAKDRVHITRSLKQTMWGKKLVAMEPSMFLLEI